MSAVEKDGWINKAALAAVLALLTWNIHTTYQLSINLAVLQEKVSRIEAVVSK